VRVGGVITIDKMEFGVVVRTLEPRRALDLDLIGELQLR
jgi:hypothetical protein